LTKLFKLAYPEIKETKNLLIDKFRSGLQRELREKVTDKDFSSMEKLIQCVEKHVKQVDRATMERQAEARIRMVNIPSDPGTEEFQSALRKEQQEMNRKLSDVCIATDAHRKQQSSRSLHKKLFKPYHSTATSSRDDHPRILDSTRPILTSGELVQTRKNPNNGYALSIVIYVFHALGTLSLSST